MIRLTPSGTRLSYDITQFYLTPDRGDIPSITHSQSWCSICWPSRYERRSWPEPIGANILLKDVTQWTESRGRHCNPVGFVLPILSRARYHWANHIRWWFVSGVIGRSWGSAGSIASSSILWQDTSSSVVCLRPASCPTKQLFISVCYTCNENSFDNCRHPEHSYNIRSVAELCLLLVEALEPSGW